MKKKLMLALTLVLSMVLATGALYGCKGNKGNVSNEDTAFVIMSEELDGVFNPFFATAAPDSTVLGMTQLAMLSSDAEGNVAYGKDEATVVLDFMQKSGKDSQNKNITDYTFVLKNDIVFSDGKPLTIRDVLFNMYVYLDPVYTGSSTMYSTDIVGLADYRTQTIGANSSTSDALEKNAMEKAQDRRNNLINAVNTIIESNKGTTLSEAEMKAELQKVDTDGKKKFVSDYELLGKTFKEELNSDFNGNKDAYVDEPYKFNAVEAFFFAEGYVEWDKKTNTLKDWGYNHDAITTREAAIDVVYSNKMTTAFEEVMLYWGSANIVLGQFAAEAKEELLNANAGEGELKVPFISGIEVVKSSTVTINDKSYKVADSSDLKNNYTVKNSDEYQVIKIRINGVDPKAIWNFGFSVSPLHYYSSDALTAAFDGTKNFGVKYASVDFMEKTLKGGDKVGLPIGAGPYKATDKNDSATPVSSGFKSDNIVYFTRNEKFLLGAPKIKRVRYQVINQAQSINVVAAGNVHFSMPQATASNMASIASNKNLDSVMNQQLGYGYIGVNAGKVTNVNLRRAIMSAMDVTLCLQYYSGGLAENLYWPMSKVSWAYPKTSTGKFDDTPTYPYGATDAKNIETIKNYMRSAGATIGSDGKASYQGKPLKYTFTIAGANLTEHPTYLTFKKAAELLEQCGWEIEVRPDNTALSKLSTGSLDVWAAAWGSTIDPDMYQVYHKNSTATSVLNWGYREIKANTTLYAFENRILNNLSVKIDNARKTLDQNERASIYKDALKDVMDLAVELPTYQRNNLYVFNSDIVDVTTLIKSDSAFIEPLSKIWEVSLKESK